MAITEINVTREQIVELVENMYGKPMACKMERIMDGFKTVNEFLAGNEGAMLAAYRKARPNSHHDLGNKFWKVYGWLVGNLKEQTWKEKKAAEEKEQARQAAEEKERKENPRFTAEQIRALSSLMDVCGIEEIDLKRIYEIFDSMKVKLVNKGA